MAKFPPAEGNYRPDFILNKPFVDKVGYCFLDEAECLPFVEVVTSVRRGLLVE
jgi:hypothetical protein